MPASFPARVSAQCSELSNSMASVNFPVAELSLDSGLQSDSGSTHQVLSPRAKGVEPNMRCSLFTLVEPVHKAGTLSTLVEPSS